MQRREPRNSRNLNLRGGFCAEGTRVEAYGHSEVSLIRINPLRNALSAAVNTHSWAVDVFQSMRMRRNNLHDCGSFVDSPYEHTALNGWVPSSLVAEKYHSRLTDK